MAALQDLHFEDGVDLWSKEMHTFMHWFVLNTTDRIFDYMTRMQIDDTGKLRRSIHGIVYNNAGGNLALVRIFFLNYGRFLEYGLGRNYIFDSDLDNPKTKEKEGIRIEHTDRDFVSAFDRDAKEAPMKIEGETRWGKKFGSERKAHHKARPFLMRAIYAEAYKMQKRLAENFVYVSAVHLSRSFIKTVYDAEQEMFIADDARDAEWLREMKLTIDENNKNAEQLRRELHAMMLTKYDIGD